MRVWVRLATIVCQDASRDPEATVTFVLGYQPVEARDEVVAMEVGQVVS